MINVPNAGFGGKMVVFKYKFSSFGQLETSGEPGWTNICLMGSGAEALCFCFSIRQRKSQILTWCVLTQALKSVNLSGDLWFIQYNSVITMGKHRWSSVLPGATIPKLVKEWNDKAGSRSLDPKDRRE